MKEIQQCDCTVALYGYVRRVPLLPDFLSTCPNVETFTFMRRWCSWTPRGCCSLPEKQKRRSLNEKEKMVYAPMSGMGAIVYDMDAVH